MSSRVFTEILVSETHQVVFNYLLIAFITHHGDRQEPRHQAFLICFGPQSAGSHTAVFQNIMSLPSTVPGTEQLLSQY